MKSTHITVTVPAQVDDSHLPKHTEGFADWPRAVRQLFNNAHDAGAKRIEAFFSRSGSRLDFHVVDDGKGVSQKGLEALASLDLSPPSEVEDSFGKNGNGSKGFVHHARALRVESRRPNEDRLFVIEYTPSELIAMWKTGTATWQIISPVPHNHKLQSHGTIVTMVDVGHGEYVRANHDRSLERIIEEVGQEIPTFLSHKITLFDERKRAHTLKPRRLLGKKIEGEGSIEGIGLVSYEFGVVPNPDAMPDPIKLWALEEVCDIRTFFSKIKLTKAIASLLPTLRVFFEHPQFNGIFAAPGLKKLVNGTSRESFKTELYDDTTLIFRILCFMHQVILPRMEVALGKETTDRMLSSDTALMKSDLVRALQSVGSAPSSSRPATTVDPDKIQVSPSMIESEPNDQFTLQVKNPKPGVVYRWDASKSGGVIDRKTGTSIIYTAGMKTGNFILEVLDGKKSHTCTVSIKQELLLAFTIPVHRVEPGATITLNLKNTRHTSQEFLWDSSKCGGELEVSKDTLSARYTAGDEEKECSVQVTEKNPIGSPKSARAFIFVENGSIREEPSDSVFHYPANGKAYQLQLVAFTGEETASLSSYERPSVGSHPHKIMVNTGHAGYSSQTDAARRMFAFINIALCIAQVEGKESNAFALRPADAPAMLQSRASFILTAILTRGNARE